MKTKEGVKCERLFDESLISVADQVLQRGRRAGAAVGTEHVVHHRTITRNGQGKSGWSGESTKCLSFISLGKEREREREQRKRESQLYQVLSGGKRSSGIGVLLADCGTRREVEYSKF